MMKKCYLLFLVYITSLFYSQQTYGRIFNLYPEGHPSYTTSIQQLIVQPSFGGHTTTDTLILHDGIYYENINLYSGDYNVCIMSANGYEHTILAAASTSDHVIDIGADNVTIQGLTIYGALSQGRSGVFISGSVDNAVIKNNRIGYDASHRNYQGVSINGSSMYDYSHSHTISGNICSYNYDSGIYVQYSHNNFFENNVLEQNGSSGTYKSGIYLVSAYNNVISSNVCNNNNGYGITLKACSNNTVSGNTSNNNNYGIYIANSSVTNFICGNSCGGNSSFGLIFSGASNNYVFLNNLSNSSNIGEYVGSANNIKYSPVKMHYLYASNNHKNFMGNYFSNRGGDDNDGDGIGSAPIYGDSYPLWLVSSNYYFQSWSLNSGNTMKENELAGKYYEAAVAPGGSYTWVSDKAAPSALNFTAGDNWEGQVTFSSALASGHSFQIEIGVSSDGVNYTAAGHSATITGNGTSRTLQFNINSTGFSLNPGEFLAFRISNNSSSTYSVCCGGSFSLLSAPAGSDPLPVELSGFKADMAEGSVRLSWRTISEINNYGFEIERRTQKESWIKTGFVKGAGMSSIPRDYLFVDSCKKGGVYHYRLKQIDADGNFRYHAETEIRVIKETGFVLEQNYPNPFNPSTKIKFSAPEPGKVTIIIYDVLGRLVKTLTDDYKDAGAYEVTFDAGSLSGGVYLYQVKSGKYSDIKKMILLR